MSQTFAYVDNVTVCGIDQEDHDRQDKLFQEAAEIYNIRLNPKKTVKSTKRITSLGYIIENWTLKPDPERLKPLLELPPPCNLTEQRQVTELFRKGMSIE